MARWNWHSEISGVPMSRPQKRLLQQNPICRKNNHHHHHHHHHRHRSINCSTGATSLWTNQPGQKKYLNRHKIFPKNHPKSINGTLPQSILLNQPPKSSESIENPAKMVPHVPPFSFQVTVVPYATPPRAQTASASVSPDSASASPRWAAKSSPATRDWRRVCRAAPRRAGALRGNLAPRGPRKTPRGPNKKLGTHRRIGKSARKRAIWPAKIGSSLISTKKNGVLKHVPIKTCI